MTVRANGDGIAWTWWPPTDPESLDRPERAILMYKDADVVGLCQDGEDIFIPHDAMKDFIKTLKAYAGKVADEIEREENR